MIFYYVIFNNHSFSLTLNQFGVFMKQLLSIVKWTAIVAGVIAIPILIKRKMEEVEQDRENIRYDINDYISESGL